MEEFFLDLEKVFMEHYADKNILIQRREEFWEWLCEHQTELGWFQEILLATEHLLNSVASSFPNKLQASLYFLVFSRNADILG